MSAARSMHSRTALWLAGLILLSVVSSLALGSAAAESSTRYTCPMHPHYISTDADGSCPICGMDLVPVASTVAGSDAATVTISPEIRQSIGIQTAPVVEQSLTLTLRAFGVVEVNQAREHVVASRLEGWVKALTVNTEGSTIAPGGLLYTVYSPDLIAAQQELVTLLSAGQRQRVEAVRQRLRSLGLQPRAVDQLMTKGKVLEAVPVYAEDSGTVTALTIRQGDYLVPGAPVMRLQSYEDVWVVAAIPEADLPLLGHGTEATLTFPSVPGAIVKGQVDYIYPTIDPRARTGRLRIVVSNPSQSLRPGAYADVSFGIRRDPQRVIPTAAVLRDSRGSHVMVALGDGRFVGREVQLGISSAGLTEVRSGLAMGERVVTRGQFLLDSETNLRAGMVALGTHDTHSASLETDSSSQDDAYGLVNHVIDSALYLHEAIRDDYLIRPSYLDPAIAAMRRLATSVEESTLITLALGAERVLLEAQRAKATSDLELPLERLSEALWPWLEQEAAHYQTKSLRGYRSGASNRRWLQPSGEPANPYDDGTPIPLSWSPKADASPIQSHAGSGGT